MTSRMTTTKIIETPEGPAVLLPEGFRFEETTVSITRDDDAVIVEPLPPAEWPEGFFESIRIDDPTFKRHPQGEMPQAPSFVAIRPRGCRTRGPSSCLPRIEGNADRTV